MRWLLQKLDNWLSAQHEHAKLARVEEELRIQRELEWLEQRRSTTAMEKTVVVTQTELMSQGMSDLQRRC